LEGPPRQPVVTVREMQSIFAVALEVREDVVVMRGLLGGTWPRLSRQTRCDKRRNEPTATTGAEERPATHTRKRLTRHWAHRVSDTLRQHASKRNLVRFSSIETNAFSHVG